MKSINEELFKYNNKYIHDLSFTDLNYIYNNSFMNDISYWGRILQLLSNRYFDFPRIKHNFPDQFNSILENRNSFYNNVFIFSNVEKFYYSIMEILYFIHDKLDFIFNDSELVKEFGLLNRFYKNIIDDYLFVLCDIVKNEFPDYKLLRTGRFQWEVPSIRLGSKRQIEYKLKELDKEIINSSDLFGLVEFGFVEEALFYIKNHPDLMRKSSIAFYTFQLHKILGTLNELDVDKTIQDFLDYSEKDFPYMMESFVHNNRKSQFFSDLYYTYKSNEYFEQYKKYLSKSLSLIKHEGVYKAEMGELFIIRNGELGNDEYSANYVNYNDNKENLIENIAVILKDLGTENIKNISIYLGSSSNHLLRDLFPNFFMFSRRNIENNITLKQLNI